ncbi:MAG: heavy-metal-associated domain-containing protein [Candidatus Diapherotrites archaeon]
MQEIELKVKGMHCNSCVSLIKMDLEELKGILSVSGDFKKEIIEVVFDEKILSINEIIEKIEKTGYTVKDNKSRDDEIDF